MWSFQVQFAQVTKAHAILTDEKAAANYEKYGSVDGYQGFSFGMPGDLLRFQWTHPVSPQKSMMLAAFYDT